MNNEENNKNDNTELNNRDMAKKKSTSTTEPTHGVNPLLVTVIKNHHAKGMDLDRLAALTMLSKTKVQEVIDSL